MLAAPVHQTFRPIITHRRLQGFLDARHVITGLGPRLSGTILADTFLLI
jgi:hypothetical protein